MNNNEFNIITLAKNKILFWDTNELYLKIKRLIDIILSLTAIILLLPIFLIIIIAIRLDSEGKALFRHYRLGKNGKKIGIYKFRTMVINADEIFRNFTREQKEEYEKNFKLENDPRITRIGNFLRKTSLDELPQLLNILIGDMSLIGPRPVVEREIEKFGNRKNEYLSVLPGLTGWWACNGRSDTSYDERIELELYYIRNISFKLDIKVFFKTIYSVLKKDGAR